MKFPFLTLSLFSLSFLGITTLALRAESVSEQTVTRENYRECLQSVASQEDSSEFYGANIMAEGIIQTPANDGSFCYMMVDDIDSEAAIHGLTKLQQEFYCSWMQHQKQNEGALCYLKNDNDNGTLPDNQETVIIISSNEREISPLMMFDESEKKKEGANATQQKRIDGDGTSAPQNLSSLQQRGTQPAKIKESDASSVMSDLTANDSTRVASYHSSPTQLEQKIIVAREEAFQATQELLSFQAEQQQQIEVLWDSYRNIQKTLTSAYTLRSCLKKSNTDQLQAYQQIVHGICREAESAYTKAQQKLKIFQQLPGCTPASHTFIEQAYAKFSKAQENLYELKQQHEQGLSADADSVSSTLVKAYENSKHPSKITPSSLSKISKPTAEEQEALRLEQFLKEHQWQLVEKKGRTVALPGFSQEENEVRLPLEEETLQKASSIDKTVTPIDHNTLSAEHQPTQEKSHQTSPEIAPTENSDHSDGEKKVASTTSAPSKKKPQKKKKVVSELVSTSQPSEKSDAEWEAEISKKFPLDKFDLEKENYHQFQENAARKVKSLIEDPTYSYLFDEIVPAALEGMRNLEKHNYCIEGTESAAVLALKKFIKLKINEDYYPLYLANEIKLAKTCAQSHAEWQARASSRAAEAERQLLALLEAETQTKQQASTTKKLKGKKK